MDQVNFLQIFLIVDALLIGMVIPVAIRHAYAHFKHDDNHQSANNKPQAPPIRLSPEAKEKLLQRAQANLQAIIDRSAADFEHNLRTITNETSQKFEKIASSIIDDETKSYQTIIQSLQKQVEDASKNTQAQFSLHQKDIDNELEQTQVKLESQLKQQIAEKQAKLTQDLETKLADAVASFLSDTLQHNVDLGAQNSYLIATLEEHKDDLKRSLSDGS